LWGGVIKRKRRAASTAKDGIKRGHLLAAEKNEKNGNTRQDRATEHKTLEQYVAVWLIKKIKLLRCGEAGDDAVSPRKHRWRPAYKEK